MTEAFCNTFRRMPVEIPHTTNWLAAITNLCFSNSELLTRYKSLLPNYACYNSTTAVTSMLKAFADKTRELVYSKIRSSVSKYGGGYSFIGDEAEDESGVERATHIVRYLNDDGRAIEAFVGLEKLATTDAAALLVAMKRVLCEKIGLKISQMVAVGFDGGSQYRGKNAGLQAKLRTESPNLLYIWCNNHKLQLSCVYATKSKPAIKRMVDGLVSLRFFSIIVQNECNK